MKRFLSIAVASLSVVVAAAFMQPTVTVSAASSASLSIAPKKNYVIEQGKSIDDKLTIRNLDPTQPLELSLRVIDFTFSDQGGTPKLMLDPSAPQTTWSLKPFLTVPDTVTVAPSSSKTIDMNVTIPAGVGAGSYYSAILYSSGSSEGGNVGLSASGVTLVFTSIPGKVKEDLQIKKFGAYREATSDTPAGYMWFMNDEPKMLGYTLENKGNVFEAPVGSITLRDMFGHKTIIEDINPNRSLALIGQTRTFTACIKIKEDKVDVGGSAARSVVCTEPGLWPGRHTATLEAFYGQNGNNTQEIIKTVSFWYMPLWALALLFVILMVVAYYGWRLSQVVKRMKNGGTIRRKSSRK